MKKILIVFSLLLNLSLYGMDKEPSITEQQYAISWANKYCQEHHINYASLSKDRYFICNWNSEHIPKELKGTVILTSVVNPWLESLLVFMIVFVFIVIIGGLSWLVIEYSEKKIIKGNYEDKSIRLNRIKSYKTTLIAKIIVALVIGILSLGYIALKKYSVFKLRNGDLQEVKTILPIVNLIKNKDEIIMFAVSNGRIEILKYLIEEKKYNPNVSAKIEHTYETTPLGLALANESYDIADYLKKYLPNDRAVDIITASRSFDMELLKKSIRLNKPKVDKILDAFLVSIKVSNYEAMKYLYSLEPSIINKKTKTYNHEIGIQSDSPIEVAIESDNIQAFDFLLEKGFKIKSDKKWLIHHIFIPTAVEKSKKIERKIIKMGLINHEEFQKIKEDVDSHNLSKYYD